MAVEWQVPDLPLEEDMSDYISILGVLDRHAYGHQLQRQDFKHLWSVTGEKELTEDSF